MSERPVRGRWRSGSDLCPRCARPLDEHPHTTNGVYSETPEDCPGWAERCPVAECRNPARPGMECAAHQLPLDERIYDALIEAGFDETDAMTATGAVVALLGQHERCLRCGARDEPGHQDWCGCDPSQTSVNVDAVPDERAPEVSAQKGTPDLATPGSDNAAGVAGTTGPTS